ncbi:MAG TPA: 3-oxoacyl-[acyl-carrier-protein] reductase [Ignavibacteriaceae bacterium]|jgi:3-oxoacyl-[acyl-carrier protein] reductase|nr:3-oxoacyl-[acyl-carrier-protein] reductase [Ignavibacteriaceae bacterium]
MLKDKVSVITGGARGIGRAIASEFLKDGANVVIIDKFFPEDFEDYKNSVRGEGKLSSKSVDITDFKATESTIDEIVKEFGRVDVLVNNAGITRDKLLLRMTEEDWDAVIAVNLKGAFITTRAVSKAMIKQKSGKIINISSVVGVIGNAGQSNYAASKAGLIGFTKSVAKELAGRNITVNSVAPGFVVTNMTDKLNEEQQKALLDLIPLKRGSQPEEIAGIVAFLASEKANYITGQVICVDGGMTM